MRTFRLKSLLCVALIGTLFLTAMSGALAAAPTATAGMVRGKVTDDNSNMMVAAIIVEAEDGATYRATTNAMGGYSLNLEPGGYTLTFSKGNEYATETRNVTVESLKTYYLPDVRLPALYDSYEKGWIAGDCHQHTYYSDGVNSVDEIMLGNASMGLYFGFLTDHNNSRGVPEWTGATRINVRTGNGTPRYFMGFDGVEVTTEFGHYNSLGSGLTLESYDMKLTEFERASQDKLTYARDKIMYIADCIQRIGGLAQMNHPYSATTMGVANWIEADDYQVFDLYDTIEIWNGYFVPPDGIYTAQNAMNQNYSAKLLWYGLLGQMKNGHPFHAATGGTDNHNISAPVTAAARAKYTAALPTTLEEYYDYWRSTAMYNGVPTTYIRLDPADMSMEKAMACLKSGNSFITSGPVVLCDIGGVSYGETLSAKGYETLTVNTDIWNRDGLSEIRVVVNGETVQTIHLDEGTDTYREPLALTAHWQSMDWILFEVLGPVGQYAITNPIIIE